MKKKTQLAGFLFCLFIPVLASLSASINASTKKYAEDFTFTVLGSDDTRVLRAQVDENRFRILNTPLNFIDFKAALRISKKADHNKITLIMKHLFDSWVDIESCNYSVFSCSPMVIEDIAEVYFYHGSVRNESRLQIRFFPEDLFDYFSEAMNSEGKEGILLVGAKAFEMEVEEKEVLSSGKEYQLDSDSIFIVNEYEDLILGDNEELHEDKAVNNEQSSLIRALIDAKPIHVDDMVKKN